MVRIQTDENVFSRIRGIVEKGLQHLFIISSSHHFSSKTDFEQYLFKLRLLSLFTPRPDGNIIKKIFSLIFTTS